MEQFNDIYKVKCLNHAYYCDDSEKLKAIPQNTLLIVSPHYKLSINNSNFQPSVPVKLITEISLQTIDIEIYDWNVLFDLFKELRNCITDVVGDQSYTNLVERKKDEAMAIFWNFEKENTTLILSVQDMSVMAHNEKRLFLIT